MASNSTQHSPAASAAAESSTPIHPGGADGAGGAMSAQEQDAKTQAQMNDIHEEIRASQKLTSGLLPISELSLTFAGGTESDETNGNGFLQGCAYLETVYASYRAVRGDGNCYYRAFLFAIVEHLCKKETSAEESKRIRGYVEGSIEEVVKCGYDRFTIEMFHEEFVDLLASVEKERESSSSSSSSSISSALCDRLNEENATSDYCVWYLRVITSVYLKSDPNRFVHFLDDPSYTDVATYCTREIEPMGRECTMVGVLALAEAFRIRVDVEYMDGRPLGNGGKLTKHTFGVNANDGSSLDGVNLGLLCITLLYRPGHYDILYK